VSVVGRDGDGVLVQSIIDLRHNLGLPVVAEGVDSKDTLNALSRWVATWPRAMTWPRPLPPDQL
jgi:diguanylate cyclase